MAKRFVYTTALGILALGCGVDVSRPVVGNIGGKVTVAGDGTPIAGAQVDVSIRPVPPPPAEFSTVTDRGGNYHISLGWSPGLTQIIMLVSKSGFEPVTESGLAFAGEEVRYDVSLTPTNRCTGAVEVAVDSALLKFSWTPACRLWFVLVEADSSGADQWSVISDSINAISPPVFYGVPGFYARTLEPWKKLVPGTTYKVSVFRWTGPGAQDGELVGLRRFTP